MNEAEPIPEPQSALDQTDADTTNAVSPPCFLRWSHVAAALILCAIYGLLSLRPLWHTDVWGHVHYGKWILQHRAFPDREPFTPYADPNQSLAQTQWLAQVVYAQAVSKGGDFVRGDDPVAKLEGSVELLLSLHLFVLTAVYVFFWLAFCRMGGSTWWANVAVVLLFFGILSASLYQRPQMLGMLCFAIVLFVVSRPESSRLSIVALPAMLVLWANLHGSFVVGLAFLGLFAASRLVQMRIGQRGQPWWATIGDPQAFRPAIAFLASVAAIAALNPHGPNLYWLVATFASRPNIHLLDEWQPIELRPGAPGFWPFAISLVVTVLWWLLSGCSRSALFAAVVPFAFLPLLQQRTMTWWLPLACWFVAALGPAVVGRLRFTGNLPTLPPGFLQTFLVGLLASLALFLSPPVQWLVKGKPRPLTRTLTAATPWKLGLELQASPENRGRWLPRYADVIRAYPEQRFRGSIFASETVGDYLLTAAPAGSPVVLYSHAHVFSTEHFLQCMDAKNARGAWKDWLSARHVNMIVVEPDLSIDLAYALRRDPDWQVIVDDGAVAGPRSAGNRLFIAVRKNPV